MSIEGRERFGSREFERLQQTNWWIITGGPDTGKSTLIKNLERRKYKVRYEAARDYIDEQLALGRNIEEIRADETAFQIAVLRKKEQIEDETPVDQLTFWDRGLHGDSMAYFLSSGRGKKSDSSDIFKHDNVTVLKRQYKGILFLDKLPYKNDYARIETEEEAAMIHSLIGYMYQLPIFGHELIRVPVFPDDDLAIKRAQFVIDRVRELDPSVPDLPYREEIGLQQRLQI